MKRKSRWGLLRAGCCVLLCCAALEMSACAIRYDKVVRLIDEPAQQSGVTQSAASAEETAEERIGRARAAYLHEPVLEREVMGAKLEYVVLEEPERRALAEGMEALLGGIVGLDGEAMERAYGVMEPALAGAVRESGYYDAMLSEAQACGLSASVRSADVAADGVACRLERADGTGVLRCRAAVVVHSEADAAFFGRYPYPGQGDVQMELWAYFVRDGEDYRVAGYETMYPDARRLFLFYPGFVAEKAVGDAFRQAQTRYEYTGLGVYALTEGEYAALRQTVQAYLDNYFAFSAADPIAEGSDCAPYAVGEVRDAAASGAVMEYRLTNLPARAVRVKKSEGPDAEALCVDVDLLGYLRCEGGDAAVLREGIWPYRLRCILEQTGEGYVLRDTALEVTSEGELDVDFYAESLDQG